MILRLLPIFLIAFTSASAAPFASRTLFGGGGLREMSWAVENGSDGRIMHMAMHDLANNAIRYSRISPDFNAIHFEYFGLSEPPPSPNVPQSYTSIAIADDGGIAVAYTAFESLPVPAYHLHIAKKPPGGSWTTEKVLEIVSINRIQLALRHQDINQWRIVYSDPAQGELRFLASNGSHFKVCDLISPANEVGFDLVYYYLGAGSLAYYDSVNQWLRTAYISDSLSSTHILYHLDVDQGPGVGLDARFARNSAGSQTGYHHLVYRDPSNHAIKLAKFHAGETDCWVPETVMRDPNHALKRPSIAFSFTGDPIVVCFRESWKDLLFSQRVQGEWYGDRHSTGASYAHLPSFEIFPESGGGFSLLAENLAAEISADARKLLAIGPIQDFSDADGDGVPLRFEQAFAMDTSVKDRHHLPAMGTVDGNLVYGVRKTNGGTFDVTSSQYFTDDWRIWIEVSEDLQNWSSDLSDVQRTSTTAVNQVRVSTYAPVTPGRKMFFRTRIERRE